MSLPIVLREEAQKDFDDAFDHYAGRQEGLGIDFAERVADVFDRIAANPKLHAVVLGDIRKAVVRRFPYCRDDGLRGVPVDALRETVTVE